MTAATPPSPVTESLKQPSINPLGLVFLVLLLTMIGFAFVQRFGNIEEQREMLHWQNKLNLIADSRAADVDGWLEHHFRELEDVAANPSLQLYLTTLMSPQKAEEALPQGEEPAQAVFLRNLLVVTAERMGFTTKTSQELNEIKANVARATGAGIGILDMHGKPIVATQSLGALEEGTVKRISDSPRGKAGLLDAWRDESGVLRIGFMIPVYPIQSDKKPEQQIAWLVGLKALNGDFTRLLVQPGVTDKTLEARLLRKENSNVSLVAGTVEAGKGASQFALSTPELDMAYAVTNPGVFALQRDAQSNKVLMTSRSLTHAPWVLLLHIDRDQALHESDSWRGAMQFTMLAALLALICAVVAAWWYGSSRRAMHLQKQTAKLASYSMAQETLLRLVSDTQPEPIFIVDAGKVVRFANQKTAERFRISQGEIAGKSLAGLMGTELAKIYGDANESVLAIQQPLTRLQRVGAGIEAHTYSSTHVPLAHIPVDGLSYPTPGVLVVDRDITEIMLEKERRERILHQLINTLVRLVDARDPYSANHSQAVSTAAREVAQGLGLSPVLVETARIAGKIMNIGKVVVSADILTKQKVLEKDEIQSVRDGIAKSVALLQGIEFDGPVVGTLRQCGEWVNGSGPLGLKGEDILITARIIAAANSFVGMISPRAWRSALSVEMATGTLLQNVDTQFDRKVVVALINFVENKKGRESLLQLVTKKAA